jgi:hypothetical protein
MLPLLPCVFLQTTGGLGIAKTAFLQSLQGLGSLKGVDGSLVMFDNEGLKTLQGLGPVQQVFVRVWIDGNPGLTDLRGLEVGTAQEACQWPQGRGQVAPVQQHVVVPSHNMFLHVTQQGLVPQQGFVQHAP